MNVASLNATIATTAAAKREDGRMLGREYRDGFFNLEIGSALGDAWPT